MNSPSGDRDRGEITRLREEVDALNSLLEESAGALYTLNEKLHAERERNEKLLTYIEEADESLQSSCTEAAELKLQVAELVQRNRELERALLEANLRTTTPHINSNSLPAYSKLLEIVAQESATMNIRSSELAHLRNNILHSTKTLAEDLCDQMIGADEELSRLFSRFPSVDFERKAPEADPYKSTKGWAGRMEPKGSTERNPEGVENSANHSHSKATPEYVEGYLFGSPSERFPMHSPQGNMHEEGEEHDIEDDNSAAQPEVMSGAAEVHEDAQSTQSALSDEVVLDSLQVDLDAYKEWKMSNS